ncbi:MAG TPA: gliding motility-associated C-terminal domain-containing protein, partial [Puia sp.]|nr:gliding motility-associated C-terminal domain-containing protein [Puia sp.]
GATSPYQEKITLFASEYPSIVPYGSTACLTKNTSTNAWFPLCTTFVSVDKPGWVKASFSFTAPKDFNSFAIGPTCDTIPFPAPQDGALLGNYAYFLDDLQLYEATIPPTIISLASGSFCDNPSSPVVLQMQTASYYLGSSFQWYKDHVPLKNENSSTIIVSGTQYGEGWYSCQVQNDSICIQSDSLLVHWIPVPSTNALGAPDTTYCDRDTAYINAYQDFTTTYYWQNGSTSPVLGTNQPGTYSVLIQNVCGSAKAEKTVHFEKCNYNVYVPNAFSPNDDGINDYFRIKFYEPPGNFRMSVFNRYGQRIFYTTDPSKGWDGKVNDVPQPTGAYVWMIEYDEHHGPSKFQKGTVVLVR